MSYENYLTELPDDETRNAIYELLDYQFLLFWYGEPIV